MTRSGFCSQGACATERRFTARSTDSVGDIVLLCERWEVSPILSLILSFFPWSQLERRPDLLDLMLEALLEFCELGFPGATKSRALSEFAMDSYHLR